MTDQYDEYDEYDDDDEEDEEDEEGTITFEPDEALILALNEVSNLKELMEDQDLEIDKLRKELLAIKKIIKKS
jgi:hypothetical protein